MKYSLPKTVNALNALITEAILSATKAKEAIQIAAIAILYHTYKHGDYTKANDLVLGLGQGVKRDSLVAFFVKFGGLQVNKDKPSEGFNGWKGGQFIEENFELAKETMWYDLKKDTNNGFEGYSLEDALRKVINNHTKTMKKVSGLTPEEQAKVNLAVSDTTIQALLKLVNIEAVVEQEQPSVEEEIAALINVNAA